MSGWENGSVSQAPLHKPDDLISDPQNSHRLTDTNVYPSIPCQSMEAETGEYTEAHGSASLAFQQKAKDPVSNKVKFENRHSMLEAVL